MFLDNLHSRPMLLALVAIACSSSVNAENGEKFELIPSYLNFQEIEVASLSLEKVSLNSDIDEQLIKEFAAQKHDIKTTPGSACQPFRGFDSQVFDHRARGIVNASFDRKLVTCPIVRDNVTHKGAAHVRAYVEVAGAGSLACAALSLGAFGGFISGTVDISTVNPGVNELNMFLPSSAVNGNYVMVCSMPEQSRVSSYRLTEKVSTDEDS